MEELGDLVYEVLKSAAHRTRIVKNFAKILDSDSEWKLVCTALKRLVRGSTAPNPAHGATSSSWARPSPPSAP